MNHFPSSRPPFSTSVGALALALAVTACSRDPGGSRTEGAQGNAPAGALSTAQPTGRRDSALLARADAGRIQGNPTAPVWVVEVSDFQCPYCKMWHDSTYQPLIREYVRTGKVRLAYVNFPLPNHANALPAAEAAMCASAQGKFWEMHDALFDAQERWAGLSNPSAHFDSLATAKGIDAGRLRRCIESDEVLPLVRSDYDRSEEAGVAATPSFIVGGDVMLRGMQPIQNLRRAIDAKLAGGASPSRGGVAPPR